MTNRGLLLLSDDYICFVSPLFLFNAADKKSTTFYFDCTKHILSPSMDAIFPSRISQE